MMEEIPVYLFTGFLDAGKTKFIQETLEDARFNNGESTLLLLCEEGEEEYDPSTFSGPNVFIEQIADQSELKPANLERLQKKHAAERVIVEYNGMWMLDELYQNMPESAVTFADKGNPNNWLSSITVDGYALTPAFSGANTSYSLVVPDSAASINVGATAVAGTSTVSGTGNYSLNYGDNTIQITCISQSGDSRTYTLIVARAGGSAGGTIQVADDAAITPFYPIGTYVTGIEPGTSASTVASGIGTQNCTVKILNADGSENTQTVGTGNKLAVYVGDTLVQQYEIVVYGDINGDGKVSNLDLVLMQKQILGIESQSGSRLEAANVSKDGGISNKDLVILQKHILGISQIDQ